MGTLCNKRWVKYWIKSEIKKNKSNDTSLGNRDKFRDEIVPNFKLKTDKISSKRVAVTNDNAISKIKLRMKKLKNM